MHRPYESNSLLRRLYRRYASFGVKKWVSRRVHRFILLRGRIRWSLSSPKARQRWMNRRLRLDGYGWLFLVGVNNSGTTLLSTLLGLHPEIRDLRTEGHRITRALPRPRDYALGRLWAHKLEAFRWTEADHPGPAERCKFDWAYHAPRRDGYLLEKSPPNAARSRWLQANFQPCRFIVITRNPYAVCEGICRRKHYPVADAALHWKRAHEVLLEDLPNLESALRLTYEQLCDDTESVLRQIEEFLELRQPFDDALLQQQFPVHNIENQPARIRNFNDRSISRLSDDDIRTITRVIGPVMQAVGYQPIEKSASATTPMDHCHG